MEKDFWLERWEREEIGFHQDEVNPYLRQYWQELHLARDSVVFVPHSWLAHRYQRAWPNSDGWQEIVTDGRV